MPGSSILGNGSNMAAAPLACEPRQVQQPGWHLPLLRLENGHSRSAYAGRGPKTCGFKHPCMWASC